jgi:hypothetical protein
MDGHREGCEEVTKCGSDNKLKSNHAIHAVAVGILVIISPFSVSAVLAQTPQNAVVYDKDLTIDNLPEGIDKRNLPGVSKGEVREMLLHQPTIVLDGATLTITPPKVGSSRSIAVKNLELRKGAKIITNGVNLEIDALLISSDKGQIVSFDETTRHVPDAAAQGNSGRAGLGAGTLVLNGTLRGKDVLTVSLAGQDGQGGGPGSSGAPGAAGPRGENAADHAFDCAHGGGNGGNGSQGGKGGTGGNGGPGGNGGRLILRGGLATQRAQVDFSAPGGKGGAAGAGGSGGPGGARGEGGSGSKFCGGGTAGNPGPGGPSGELGGVGANAQPGSVSAD